MVYVKQDRVTMRIMQWSVREKRLMLLGDKLSARKRYIVLMLLLSIKKCLRFQLLAQWNDVVIYFEAVSCALLDDPLATRRYPSRRGRCNEQVSIGRQLCTIGSSKIKELAPDMHKNHRGDRQASIGHQ